MFDNRVLRRIFGPKRDEATGEWRKLHNVELSDLYSCFFKGLIYCSEMYKCLHEYFIKTVPDTSLHETSDVT